MKALFKTSLIVVAAAGIMALAAGTALAKPANSNIYRLSQNKMEIDPQTVVSMHSLVTNGQLAPIDEGANENIVPPDEPCVECPVPPEDDSDIPGNLDNPETPQQPETPQTVETPKVPESKLPNTGTHLVLFAGLGLTLTAVALGVRRFAVRRAG